MELWIVSIFLSFTMQVMSVRQCCRSVRVIFFCRRSSVHCTGCEWRNRDVDNTQPSMYATDSGRKEAGDQDALTSTTSLTGAASSKASLHGHLFLSVSMRRRSRCTDHRRRRFLAGKSIISRRGRRASLQAGYYYPAGSVGFVCRASRAVTTHVARDNYKGTRRDEPPPPPTLREVWRLRGRRAE